MNLWNEDSMSVSFYKSQQNDKPQSNNNAKINLFSPYPLGACNDIELR